MKKLVPLSALVLCSGMASAQYGIGTNAVNNSALFELNSTSKGFLPPRMTRAQRVAVAPTDGLMVFQTNTVGSEAAGLYVYNATTSSWTAASASSLAGSGLTASGSTLRLGGTLTQNTSLSAGTNSLTVAGTNGTDEVLNVTNAPATGSIGNNVRFATENALNYAGTENGPIVGAVGGTRSVSVTTSRAYQAQGGNFEAEANGGGVGDFHAVGLIGIASTSQNATATGSTLIGLQGGVGNNSINVGASRDWNAIGVDAFTNFRGFTTSGRSVGGNFDGYGGNTSIGLIGTVDGTAYQTFYDVSLDSKRIGIVAANTLAPTPGTDYALYGIGDVRLTSSATSGTVTVDDGTTTIESSAKLQVNSTAQGFLPPRMTGTQAEAISNKAEGLMIYATSGNGAVITSKGWWGWNGSTWKKLDN